MALYIRLGNYTENGRCYLICLVKTCVFNIFGLFHKSRKLSREVLCAPNILVYTWKGLCTIAHGSASSAHGRALHLYHICRGEPLLNTTGPCLRTGGPPVCKTWHAAHCKAFANHDRQSMEWTGSIRWIHNPVQSRRIWIGLDQKFTNSADSGLDWIEKCAMCIPYFDI